MNNHHNNANFHQSTSSTDNKLSMIRKRKRNEKPETNFHPLNSLNNLEQILSNKFNQNNNLNGLKPYSIVSEERCVICKEQLSIPSSDTYSCFQCYKYFHKKCLPFSSKDTNNHKEIICNLCEKHSEGKCFLCNKEINRDSEIKVCCELCGNLIHLDCLKGIPLHILYKRNFYEKVAFKNKSNSPAITEKIILLTQEFENSLKIFEEKYYLNTNNNSSIINICNNFNKSVESAESNMTNTIDKSKSNSLMCNKKEMLINFLKEYFCNKFSLGLSENNERCMEIVEKLTNLFYICKICLWDVDKKEKVNFFEFKIAKGTAFKRINFTNTASIHEIFAIATLIKNDSIDNTETKNDYRVDKIIDFYHLNGNRADEGYYLIKWKKNNLKYSYEYSKFVEAFEEFPKLKLEYENRKKRQIEYYEYYFNWQQRRINENNSINLEKIQSSPGKFCTKSFLQEFKKNSFDHTSDLNSFADLKLFHSIIDELESNDILIINEIKYIDEIRKTLLTPLITKMTEKDPKTKSTSENNNILSDSDSSDCSKLINTKVLICIDNETILKKWKEILLSSSKSNSNLTYLIYRFKNRIQRILYEMFYLDVSHASSAIKSLIYNEEYNRNINSEGFFKILDTVITDYNHPKIDVILIDKNALLYEYLNLFSKINFDLILMDFLEKDSVIKVKEIIKLNSLNFKQKDSHNNSHNSRMFILKSMDTVNNADDFQINFSNFLHNFYTANDYLVVPPPNYHTGLKILSKDKQFFPIKMDEMLKYLKSEFKWVVLNPNTNMTSSIRSNPYELKNSEKSDYFYLTRDENIMDLDLSYPRIILNFVSVNLTKTELVQYISILKERKNLVLNKKQENKTDLIKNLCAFCSFPGLMVKYYLNKLEDKNLKLLEEGVVNRNKLKALKILIKSIFKSQNDNFPVNLNEDSFNKIHVNVIYSEPGLDTESRSLNVFKFLKQSVWKDFEKERKYIHFYSLSSDYEEIFSNSQEQNVFILFNIFLTPKITGKFFRRMVNYFKNRNLFIFQLFIENSIEQNLVEEFYTSDIEEVLFKENILMNLLSKETKENVLKKNLINLKYAEDDIATSLITDNRIIFNISENTKLDLFNFDGLIVVDNCIQIFAKNSNFIQNQSQRKSDLDWDYILDKYFSDENITNYKHEFKFIEKRNNKIQNLENNPKQLLSSDISGEIIDKSSNKRQRLILDDEEENLPDYIIRTSVDNILINQKATEKNAVSPLTEHKPAKLSHNHPYNVEINLIGQEPVRADLQQNLINRMTDKLLINRLVSENTAFSHSNSTNNERNGVGISSSSALNIINNSQIAPANNKFKNLSVLSTSNLLFEKNTKPNNNYNSISKRIDFESYMSLIEHNSSHYVSNDILHDLNSVLINSGMNLNIRKFIFTYVMKFGIDIDNLEEYTHTLQNKIMSDSNFMKEIKIDLLRFYIEYMLVVLSKCISFEKDNYYLFSFFQGSFGLINNKPGLVNVETSQTVEIKKRILTLSKLREFLNLPNEKKRKEIHNIFQIITKTLLASCNSKIKFNIQAYNPDIFVNFIIKFLKSVSTYGYGEYRQVVESYNNCMTEEISHGFSSGNVHKDQKLKFYILWMITSPPIKKGFNVDSVLAEFLEELFVVLDKNILDKF